MKQKRTIQTFIFFVIICCCILEFSCTRHSAETGFAGISKEEIETRVEKLLEQMTLDEKIELVGGQGMGSKPNSRLGIPWIRMTDGPLGPGARGKATNYSACINMASTWDKALVERVGEAIGKETRGIGCDMILAPCINIARVPHGGRTFESFGEDPYMVTRLTEAYINGVQRQRVSVCVKHFACNNQEWNRGEVSAEVDERTLREIYLPAFKAAVQESHAWSIMAAYNLVNGTECCENEYLLTDILKNEWGFDGVVVSDWGGVCSTVKTAKSGLDLEMPDGKYMGENLLKAVKNGQVEESVIDDKVRRILRLCFRLGLFNEETTIDSTAVNTSEHRKLALEVAQKSIVLLKNESHFLPLNK